MSGVTRGGALGPNSALGSLCPTSASGFGGTPYSDTIVQVIRDIKECFGQNFALVGQEEIKVVAPEPKSYKGPACGACKCRNLHSEVR